MRIVVTGSKGTVGSALRTILGKTNHALVPWDRSVIDPEDAEAGAAWLDEQNPDALVHLGMGPEAWAGRLAGWCARKNRPFVFTSSAMVFDHRPDGPHKPEDLRSAKDEYGRYKIRCEDAIRAANADAVIARIGWQIGSGRGGNQMMNALLEQAEQGPIRASRLWTPACSLLKDTAAALLILVEAPRPGVVHLDSNAEDAWAYPKLVRALRRRHNTQWQIEDIEDYAHDQRLIDPSFVMPSLTERLLQA